MRKIAAVLMLLPVSMLIACGGGSSPDDEVAAATNQILEAESPEEVEEVCRELITARFLKEVYGGDLAACVDEPINDDDEIDDPGVPEVASVEVEDAKASVRIDTVGGETAENDGTWTLVEDQDQWKLDRLEDDFLRSSFAVSVQVVDEGVVSYEPMRRCMTRQVAKLKSADLRKLTFEAARGDEEKAKQSTLEVIGRCPRPMAEFVANELATRVIAEQGATPAQVRCARRELVPLLLVTDLSSIALGEGDFGDSSAFALAGLISGVMKQCPARSRPSLP